jgi:hypothetical protein
MQFILFRRLGREEERDGACIFWKRSLILSTEYPDKAPNLTMEDFGAEGGIRTLTPYGATPSRWCVCQFRHFRTEVKSSDSNLRAHREQARQ